MIEIYRWYNLDCTIGRMSINSAIDGLQCFTLELPDINNQRNVSCIPEGIYEYKLYQSPKHGQVLHIQDVDNRTMIEMHAGNYTKQIQGCILTGDSVKWLDGDKIPDVTNSKNTLGKILKLAGEAGTIRIWS